jgi:hypothetical protein
VSAAAKALPASTYMSGFCGYSGFHDRCHGEPCTCACHTPAPIEPPALSVVPPPTEGSAGGTTQALSDAVRALSPAVRAVNAALLHTPDDPLSLLDLLAAVRAARQELAQSESLLEAKTAAAMPDDRVEWAGGVAERRFGKDRKEWQNDDLTRAVVQLVATDLAGDSTTGEVDDMLAALLADGINRYAATNRPSWRVTQLKELGLDPGEFCHEVPGRKTVQITPAGAQ